MLIGLAVVVCFLTVTRESFGQPTPRATDRVNETKPTTSRPARPRPRPQPTTVSATPVSVDSQNFVNLGDRFREKEKWNAAEAAYKEAGKVWPANGDALLALGFLYLDKKNVDANKRLENARTVQTKLRSVDSSLASILQIEINKFQAQVAH
ncbi:MAG TPA: hypothetical protein VFS77_14090 [Pyrinomonadaceae bacterium]|nr:hypothetical protein [Pyrinomonadaceae bacterium]